MKPKSQVVGNRVLAAALAALIAAPAAAQTVVGNGASEPSSVPVCPGAASTNVDNFTVTSTPSDVVKGITYALSPAGAFGAVSRLQVYGPTGLVGEIAPQNDTGQIWLTAPVTVTGGPQAWRLAIVPKTTATMPMGVAAPAVTARVSGIMSSLTRTINDTTSATVTVDNAPDADVKLTSVTSPTATSVVFAWSTAANVVILRQMAGPVTSVLTNGTDYSVGGEVVYAPGTNQTGWTDTVSSGKTYYYKIFTKDGCKNYSAGVSVGRIVAGGTTEGALSGNGPVVGILNPGIGPVTLPFRVQVRIYSPTGLAISNPRVGFDNGTATTYATLTLNGNYGGSATGGVYEATITGTPTVAAGGRYTMRAEATNSAGTVYSSRVGIYVNNGVKGDGNLLVRDNSSQLCADCHTDIVTHSSEATGTKYGSWYSGCRTCHDPHGTTNAALVATKITPPAVNGQKSPATVVFSTRTGYAASGGVTNAATATFANGDAASNGGKASGVCQVCHSRTEVFKLDGTSSSTSHDSRLYNCALCHKHSDGFKGGGCNGCHGNPSGRTPAVSNTDSNLSAYPPVVAPEAVDFVANGGVHDAHLNKATYKRNPLLCADCHLTQDAVHPNSVTTVQWGTLATMNGATMFPTNGSIAAWKSSPTCSNYCHGATMPDGSPSTKKVADWRTGVTPMNCGACHGAPPAAPHTTRTDCDSCHGAGFTLTGITGAALDEHMNGSTPVAGCSSCHGTDRTGSVSGTDADLSGAPPALATPLPTGSVANGAHLKHVDAATYRTNPLQCEDCHLFPQATEHQNGKANVKWGTLAKTGGLTPLPSDASDLTASFTTTPQCSANYCHGATLTGGTTPNPLWNTTFTATCTQCHGSPPAAANAHPQNTACDTCHGIFSNAGYNFGTKTLAATAKATHIDQTTQVPNKGCVNCHGDVTVANNTVILASDVRASPGANANAIDTKGNNNTQRATAPGVGAHVKHVVAGMASAYACTVCHPAVANGNTSHASGTPDMAWTTPANSAAVSPTHSLTSPYNCTNYCHSNAGPVNTSGANTTPTVKTVSWTSTTAMTCTDCHDGPGAATTLSHAHQVHTSATTYAYTCEKCHANTASNATTIVPSTGAAYHVNGSHDVKLNTSPLDQSPATYVSSQCSADYCHSDGQDRTAPFAPPASIRWYDGSSNCGSCHNQGSAMATRSHTAHVNNAGTIGTNYGCVKCHTNYPTDTSVTTYSQHVDGTVQVAGTEAYSDGSADGVANGSCTTSACHQSGRDPAAAAPAYVSVQWGVTTTTCTSCHGTGGSTGAPDYADGATLATANSHASHMAFGYKCEDCHSGLVNTAGTAIVGSSHTNGVRDVAIIAGYDTNGATSNYNNTTKTCSGISCHGAGTATPIWGDGTTSTCASCHLRTPANGGDANNWVINDGTVSYINSTEWTSYGHGSTSTAGNSFAEFSAVTGDNRCFYCHDSQNASANHKQSANPFRLRGAANSAGATAVYSSATADAVVAVCWNCHDSSATVAYGVDPDGASALPKVGPATARVDSYHYATSGSGAVHAATRDGGQRCWDCHDVHGDGVNLAMIGSDTLRDAADAHGLPGTWSGTAAVLTARVAGAYATTASPYNGICQVCHTTTSVWLANGTGTTHQSNDCMTCHDHNQTTTNEAFKGSGECIMCHASTKIGSHSIQRRAIVTEFMQTWSHKRSGGKTVTNADCVVCHMEGDPSNSAMSGTWHGDGNIDLRDPDSGSGIKGVYWTGTDAGAYTSTTTYLTFTQFSRNLGSKTLEAAVQAIQINQCLKCHDNNGAQSSLARVAGAPNPGRPFNTSIAGASYTGSGITAFGSAGNVTDINAAFATTNASYHPVRGKQNNWYSKLSRLAAPWNSTTRITAAASTNSWGDLISCWDCHAPNGTASTATLTATVTAHGGATTLRGSPAISGTPAVTTNQVTLCILCHKSYDVYNTANHGAGSAFTGVTRTAKTAYLRYGCNLCHSSGYGSAVPRPLRAEDSHGSNVLRTVASAKAMTSRWATVGTPIAFIRNKQTLGNHQPARVGGSTYTGGCDMGTTAVSACGDQQWQSYSPGGTY